MFYTERSHIELGCFTERESSGKFLWLFIIAGIAQNHDALKFGLSLLLSKSDGRLGHGYSQAIVYGWLNTRESIETLILTSVTHLWGTKVVKYMVGSYWRKLVWISILRENREESKDEIT